MDRTAVTWGLGLVGWLGSYALFTRWLSSNGWDFLGGWAAAFAGADFANGLLLDLGVVSVMMLALAWWDRRRLGPRWAAAVVACLALSVSMSLAVYLVGIRREAPAA